MTGREMVLTEDSIISAPYCRETQHRLGTETQKLGERTYLDDTGRGLALLVCAESAVHKGEMGHARYKVGGVNVEGIGVVGGRGKSWGCEGRGGGGGGEGECGCGLKCCGGVMRGG